ncbi:Calcineurin-like phosphoesterase [Flavobacterium gillisiae]|uniref:Calcineurin-like phosphoesterase n=1 Tax=Flavobacterium gillisiae TaxID=150146 RepID=A0A1H4BC85_9FLAO|nr:metallophosphoesterase [Flavobacterium gillisiae]SEA45739.1 Calcineurin-like phosphoesterase [Flavobacterium gillisiae]
MKLFSDNRFYKNKIYHSLALFLILLQSCATHHPQFGNKIENPVADNATDTSKIAHTFFLIGDAGNTDKNNDKNALNSLHEKLVLANKHSTLLFLGDNIYPKGMPPKEDKIDYEIAHNKLENQLKLSKNFKGKTIFIPGNHDWYNGIKGLERQEEIVTDYLDDKKSFSPRKGCPIDDKKINDNLILITIDSQWFLEDWDKTPTLNDDCSIKSREAFFEELESILNKNKDKTVIMALHHPLMTNGSHGGQFSLKKQLFPLEQKIPLPVIGSLINLLRKTSGISPQDIQNKQYTAYVKRMKTLLQSQNNVIVVSGHDHNLQYIDNDNIKQIISGAGSKSEAARAINSNDFSYEKNGYATLDTYENGKTTVSFYGRDNNQTQLLFRKTVLYPKKEIKVDYATRFSPTEKTSIYTPEMIDKSATHNFIFGTHYRKYYGTLIESQVATLDTLYGGLSPERAGGGHQSISLRLTDPDGKEYVMRAVKKSVGRFLQSVAFKDQYVEHEFKNTYAENFLYDFYTTAHPYAPLAVGNLADGIGVFHTNPHLYYIPKQEVLGAFNADFGNELYLVEERPSESQKDLESFGKPDDIISTEDLLENLRKDEKYIVDENEYIKARLFDMLIGDWDRHYDQWRWAEYKKDNQVIYKPIPRDRDQAFSKYDGALLSILMNIPALRHMQTFKDDIKNVKWFNREPYPLDLAFLKTATEKEWIAQAKYIQENLSDETIDHAFDNLPKEVQDETIEQIKQKLKLRRAQLVKYASEYNRVLQKTVLVVGTNKKDKFIIHHVAKNKIEVSVYRIKKEGDELEYTKLFNGSRTKNIWVYGLDDDDEFEVTGNKKSSINIRLIGGQNHDAYTITNGHNTKIIDFKSKENSFAIDSKTKKLLTDDYEANLYDYKKPKYNAFSGMPTIGFNPDDGIKLGIVANYTINHFKQNPYTRKHTLKANYYFATEGFELLYNLHVPKIAGNWDFNLESQITSPNFAINYFGFGNNSLNNEELYGMDYNRVRIRMLKIAPQIKKTGLYGSTILFQTSIESFDVESTSNRFVAIPNSVHPRVFDSQQFAGASIKYSYENYDNPSLPTMGMGFSIGGSWKINLNDTKRNFPAIESKLNFNHKIDSNGKLVLATLLKGKAILNNNYDFYQGATLGGDYDLRGFRNQRFLGNQSFFQSSDIRYSIGKIKNSIVPMTYGVFGGFDYGRVWLDGETSNKWHQSMGGGIWLNGLNSITTRLTYFKSADDEGRITFGLGLGF